jgi:hypothetical protein
MQSTVYYSVNIVIYTQGRIRDFKLGGGGALKKIAPSGGGRGNFGVFRGKNHIFSNFWGGPPGPAPALYKFVLRL